MDAARTSSDFCLFDHDWPVSFSPMRAEKSNSNSESESKTSESLSNTPLNDTRKPVKLLFACGSSISWPSHSRKKAIKQVMPFKAVVKQEPFGINVNHPLSNSSSKTIYSSGELNNDNEFTLDTSTEQNVSGQCKYEDHKSTGIQDTEAKSCIPLYGKSDKIEDAILATNKTQNQDNLTLNCSSHIVQTHKVDKAWYNRFSLLYDSDNDNASDTCSSDQEEMPIQEGSVWNKYRFTSKQKKYLKNARRHKLKTNINKLYINCKSYDKTAEDNSSKQFCNKDLAQSVSEKLITYHIKLGSGQLRLNWSESNIDIKNLKIKLHKMLAIDGPFSIYINNQVVKDNKAIISNSDVIEIIIGGLGGGRKIRGDNIHPGYGCQICKICNKNKENEYFIHLQTQTNQNFVKFIQNKYNNIDLKDCVCKSCKIMLQRKFETCEDEPTCKKLKTEHCCIISKIPNLTCTNSGFKCAITVDDVAKCYNVQKEKILMTELEDVTLCKSHYLIIWKFTNITNCDLCRSKIHFNKTSDTNKVYYFDEQFLGNTCIKKINVKSPVCLVCYREYHIMATTTQIQHITSEHSHIKTIIDAINKLPELFVSSNEVTKELNTIISTFKYMLKKLYEKGAVLMRDIHLFCMKELEKSLADTCMTLEYLLDLIVEGFGRLITISKGTSAILQNDDKTDSLLIWHDANLTSCLHIALTEIMQKSLLEQAQNGRNYEVKCLEEASVILRNKLEKTDMQYTCETDLTTINFNEVTSKIDPLVWNFIFLLTTSKAERAYLSNRQIQWHKIFNDEIYTNIQTHTSHQMSRLSLISSCIFLINNRTHFPLPLLFSDVIDKYSKSSADCLHFFNMFGICTSYETLRRHQTEIVTSRMETKQLNLLNKNSFTYVSIDNVSFWASNARVRSSESDRGLNCTSYMSCQPKPNSVILGSEEKCINSSETIIDNSEHEYMCHHLDYQQNDSFFLACLFNIDHKMQISVRDEMGKPITKIDMDREAALLDCFKKSIINDLLGNVNYFESLPDKYFKQWIVDYNLSCYSDRFKDLSKNTISCGEPEMMAAAHFTGRLINIFKREGDQIEIKNTFQGSSTCTSPVNVLEYYSGGNRSYRPLISNKSTIQTVILKYDNFEFKSISTNSSTCSYRDQFGMTPGESSHFEAKRKSRARSINKSMTTNSSLPEISISDMNLNTNEDPVITFSDIQSIETDNLPAYNQIKLDIFSYMISKYVGSKTDASNLPGIKVFMSRQEEPTAEQSAYTYIDIINENADSKETMENVICKLYKTMEIHSYLKYLVVVGDGKTYDHLVKIKCEYGKSLKWLLPFPGDWHTLKNFAYVLIKMYGPGGLYDLIKIFHKGKTANSILQATSWDKTHNFLLQVFEATFRYQIELYLKYRSDSLPKGTINAKNDLLIDNIATKIIPLLESHTTNCDDMHQKLTNTLDELNMLIKENYDDFKMFLDTVSEDNENFKFWCNFVHKDCILYISLYLAIRSGNWSLRNAALYKISHYFHVSDSKYYFRLLPIHLADLLTFPQHILDNFKKGAFVSNITGSNWSSIALDEMHEMTINKDIKVAFTTPSESNVKAKLLYLPYRSMAHKSIMTQLNPRHYERKQKEDSKQFNKDLESNIIVYLSELQKSNCSLSQVILDTYK